MADGADDALHMEFLLPSGQNIGLDVSQGMTVGQVKDLVWSEAAAAHIAEDLEPDQFVLRIGGNTPDEAVALGELPAIQANVAAGRTCKMTLVDRAKHRANKGKVVSMQIGALLGFPISMFNLRGDPEMTSCRERVLAFVAEELEGRDSVLYDLAPSMSHAPLPPSIACRVEEEQLVRFHFRNSIESKGMRWDLTTTPAQILDDLFATKRSILRGVPDDAGPDDYVLKAFGVAGEYFVGPHSMLHFKLVREALLKGVKIHVSMVALAEVLKPPLVDERRFFEDVSHPEEPVYDHAALTIYSDRSAGSGGGSGGGSTSSGGVSGESDEIGKKSIHDLDVISLWDLKRRFRVFLYGVDKLGFDFASLVKKDGHGHDKAKDKAAKRHSKLAKAASLVYVTCGLYHGSRCLSTATSSLVPMGRSPRFNEYLTFSVETADMPRSGRLCFSAYLCVRDQPAADDIPLGWVNALVMDFRGVLRTGDLSLTMWPYEKCNPIGTLLCNPNVNNCPALSVGLESYMRPVVFPTLDSSFSCDIHLPVASANDQDSVDRVVDRDPLFKTSVRDEELLWEYRYYLKEVRRHGLAKLLLAAPWNSRRNVQEVYHLVDQWAAYERPLDALEILDADFPDARVRRLAVQCLELRDDELLDYMIQLVQALKYEPYHYNDLACFLLSRALCSRRVGHAFYWCLKSEMHESMVRDRFGMYLEAYLRGSGRHRQELTRQSALLSKLEDAAVYIKSVEDRTRPVLHAKLEDLDLERFEEPIPLIHNPGILVTGLEIERCKFMDSKKVPLWLVFSNADPNGESVHVIFKHGDDLRQDMLTLQMIRIMDKLWQAEDMDLRLMPYEAVATGDEVGFIEVVLNADTLANIQMAYGGLGGAFKDEPLADWLGQYNNTEQSYATAVDNFVLSCAGYCVATYVLGIGDRHNDNIMIQKSGCLFHIDFGHFLGNIKKKFGISRERTPFVFTPDMLYVMGGKDSPHFERFQDLCCRAYCTLRNHANHFINLFAMMLSTGIPELQCADDIDYLREVLKLDYSDAEAQEHFRELIADCLDGGWQTQLNWWFHNVVHASGTLRKKI